MRNHVSSEEILAAALAYHRAGRLAEAEARYRELLALDPDHADALHLAGVVAYQQNRLGPALAAIRRAIALRPGFADYHNNLGLVLDRLGQVDQAMAAFRRALELRADYPEAHNNLATALHRSGRTADAIEAVQHALRLRPSYAEAQSNLGSYLLAQGRLPEALTALTEGVRLAPRSAQAHFNLALSECRAGRLTHAIASLRSAVALAPGFAAAHRELAFVLQAAGYSAEATAQLEQLIARQPQDATTRIDLGILHHQVGRSEAAEAELRAALALRPNDPRGLNQLCIVLRANGRIDEAVAVGRQAVDLHPEEPEAHNSLGNALRDAGASDAAVEQYQRAGALSSVPSRAHHNELLALHYEQGDDGPRLAEAHRSWARRFADPLKAGRSPHRNSPDPERRLRVGFVSPDFRRHSVTQFLLPLLRGLDRDRISPFGYSNVARPDAITAQVRHEMNAWRDVEGSSDEAVAALVRDDAIDVLIDLAGHTARNRLLVFAREPAPVQIGWLGYPDTTGMSAIHYRLTDTLSDPPGQTERFHRETLLRFAGPAWCYEPPASAPPPHERDRNAPVVFGAFAHPAKLSRQTLELWRSVLMASPDSTLLLKSPVASSHLGRDRVLSSLGQDAANRVVFRPPEIDFVRHLATYNEVDVALDTFPYAGTTTTCEALWMGRPVVTRAGRTHVARVGMSLVTAVGLPDLVAASDAEFVAIATGLAGDRARLADLHSTLRGRMAGSPILDGKGFAGAFEHALREAWRKWCSRPESS